MRNKNKNIFVQYMKTMHTLSKSYTKSLLFIFLGSICFSGLSIFLALLSKEMLDRFLTLDQSVIIKSVLVTITAYILGTILGFITSYFQKIIIDKMKMNLQLSFYDNMLNSEFLFFSRLSSSDVYYRMFTDIGVMVDFYINFIIATPIKILMFLASFSIMCIWTYQLSLAILGLVLIQLFIVMLFRIPIKNKTEKTLSSEQSLIKQINTDVLNGDTIRGLGLEDYSKNKIIPFFEYNRKTKLSLTKLNLLFSSTVGLITQIINICLMLIGILFISQGKMSVGILMGFSMMAGYIYQPLNDTFSLILGYQSTKVSYIRYREFNDSIDVGRKNSKSGFINGDIKIDNISFSYNSNSSKKVIDNYSVIIHANKITHLVGENGSGKTTLMRLIARYLSPQNGIINISGIDIQDIDYEEYRKNVIAFSSNPILFNVSIKENISLGNDFTLSEIYDIIDKCALRNFIDNLENGVDTKVGQSEKMLSQGEIQKIALARVLIRNPKILILDEPLAHIDVQSVNDILNTLKTYNDEYGTTIIIISHDEIINNIVDERHFIEFV